MRGMLVDDGDAVTGFGDDIGLVKLRPCRAKERVVQRFLPGLVNAGRRAAGGMSRVKAVCAGPLSASRDDRGACQSFIGGA